MESIYKVEDRLLDEMEEFSKMDKSQPLTMEELTQIKFVSSSLDHLANYMNKMNGGGFSKDSGMGMSNGGYSNGYSNGYTNARGGQRRDSMGRFSNRGYSRMSRGRMEEEWDREPYGMY